MLDSNIKHKDSVLHEVIEENGKFSEGIIYPITRYDNILNSPKVTKDITEANNPPFLLFASEEDDILDTDVYKLINNGNPW